MRNEHTGRNLSPVVGKYKLDTNLESPHRMKADSFMGKEESLNLAYYPYCYNYKEKRVYEMPVTLLDAIYCPLNP